MYRCICVCDTRIDVYVCVTQSVQQSPQTPALSPRPQGCPWLSFDR